MGKVEGSPCTNPVGWKSRLPKTMTVIFVIYSYFKTQHCAFTGNSSAYIVVLRQDQVQHCGFAARSSLTSKIEANSGVCWCRLQHLHFLMRFLAREPRLLPLPLLSYCLYTINSCGAGAWALLMNDTKIISQFRVLWGCSIRFWRLRLLHSLPHTSSSYWLFVL